MNRQYADNNNSSLNVPPIRANEIHEFEPRNIIPLYINGIITSMPSDIHLRTLPHWYNHFMTRRNNGQLNDRSYERLLNLVNRYNEINQANPLIIHHHFSAKRRILSRRSRRSPTKKSRRSRRSPTKKSRRSRRSPSTKKSRRSPSTKKSLSVKKSRGSPTKYTIKRVQQYELGDEQFFKVTDGKVTYRDLYVDLSKNSKTGLMQLASVLQIKNKHTMKKDQLFDAVRRLIRFE